MSRLSTAVELDMVNNLLKDDQKWFVRLKCKNVINFLNLHADKRAMLTKCAIARQISATLHILAA